MMRNTLFFILLLSLYGFTWPHSTQAPRSLSKPGTDEWIRERVTLIKSKESSINSEVLRLSLTAYANAKKQGVNQQKEVLTVIDYSIPSSQKRLWVFDLKNNRTLFHTWVSHGKNSGGVNAVSFSNKNGSKQSSLGVFTTDWKPYMGGNGYSLRLNGLEAGINDKAYQRTIVIHGASYVNGGVAQKYGQIGRSWGCPAVSAHLARPLIDTIKSKTLVFAYYPDSRWLNRSRFL